MIRCLSCGAETVNGLALCDRCRAGVLVYLEFTPVYFRNLARWQPGRAGIRQVPGSREPGTLTASRGDVVGRALDEAGNTLSTWARTLADDRPGIELPDADDEPTMVARLCELFTERIVSMSTLDWVGEFVRDMAHVEADLRRLTERVVPGWYAGKCRRCRADTFVVPGLTWVTCGACGATTHAADHLEVLLDEARGWVAGPRRMAEALVALIDTETSIDRLHKRISKWGERESGRRVRAIRRVDRDGDEYGPKRYRLGEVLDVLLVEGATRVDERITRSA